MQASPSGLQYVLGKLAADVTRAIISSFTPTARAAVLTNGVGMNYPDSLVGWGNNVAIYNYQLAPWLESHSDRAIPPTCSTSRTAAACWETW